MLPNNEKTSPICNTLPPGYAFVLDGMGNVTGWESGKDLREGLKHSGQICESAWRRWTAEVLKGRKVHWQPRSGSRDYSSAACMGVYVSAHRHSPAAHYVYQVQVDDTDGVRTKVFSSLYADEAMVAFSSILLGTEGLPF